MPPKGKGLLTLFQFFCIVLSIILFVYAIEKIREDRLEESKCNEI